jgi:Protein of unknown function (DUF1573)
LPIQTREELDMRTWFLLALLVVVGIGIGVGVALGVFNPAPNASDAGNAAAPAADSRMPELPPSDGPQPHVRVDKTEFDFGEMERRATGQHSYVFTNRGDYPLKLTSGGTSCSQCTISELPKDDIAPGESASVILKWTPRSEEEHFRQTATIFTNDPNQRSITLTVSGRLIQSLALAPPELVFNNVTPETHSESKARLLVQSSQPVKITGHSLTDEATAAFYVVSYAPLAEKDVPTGYKSGWEVTVTLKPGLPFGAIHQRIRLKTDLPDTPEPEITVMGNVSNGVSVFGHGWVAEAQVLRLNVVKRGAGTKRTVNLLVNGPHRKEVSFRLLSTKPDFVKVTLGEPARLEAVTQVPLTIEIPPGSPVVNCLGGQGHELGQLLLDTGQPTIGQVTLKLQFAIVDG